MKNEERTVSQKPRKQKYSEDLEVTGIMILGVQGEWLIPVSGFP